MKLLACVTIALAAVIPPVINATPAKPVAAHSSVAVVSHKKTIPSSLVLLYSASAQGQIRSCNCTKFRFGGYGRELTLLKSIRSSAKDVLLIEGGDLCGGDSGFQADLKADVASKAIGILGYNAMAPGEEELGARDVQYLKRFDPKSVPIVCANLYKTGETKPLYPPFVICHTSGGLDVAVIGVVDGSLVGAALTTTFGMEAKNPLEGLGAIVKQARAKADLVVLVYHGVPAADSGLDKIQGIDLILTSHPHSSARIFPVKDSNSIEAPVKKLGGAVLINSETSTNWSLGRLDLELGTDARIKSAKHTLFYLDRSYDEDPAMVKVYDDYNERVKKVVLDTAAEFKKNAEALLTKRGLDLNQMRLRLHKSPFTTSDKCKDCHAQIYDIWANSSHAHAMTTLQKTKQEFDPECVRCHTTGTSVRNGFSNFKDTPQLANIQCEACHGPGQDHIKAPAKGFGKAGEETCRSCHTDERTPDFDYAASWAKIMH